MTTPAPEPPHLYRGGRTVLRGASEGALWGTAAGALVGAIFVIALVGPFLLSDPLLAVFLFLPGIVMGGGFGIVYGAVTGIACGSVLHLGVLRHRKRETPYTLDHQKLLGAIVGTLAAGLTGLALNGLQLDVLPPSSTDFWVLVFVPAVAAGATMALRAPSIVRAGYVTPPPTGPRTAGPQRLAGNQAPSGPAPLIEPPAA